MDFIAQFSSRGINPIQLVIPERIANANWTRKARNGASSLIQTENRQAIRKVMSLNPGQETNFTYRPNTELLGGQSYPILNAILGTAAGIASFGVGLLFTVASTGLSLAQKSQRVLARPGDEVWQVEEIGKIGNGSSNKAVHVCAYFIVDPFRGQSQNKGWLIHEERNEITLE